MKRETKSQKIYNAIKDMKVGEQISKDALINELYNDYDEFIDYTFTVHFTHAKKLLPGRSFRSRKRMITRDK